MLTESLASGPSTPAVRELTIGDALREAARDCPDAVALLAGTARPGGPPRVDLRGTPRGGRTRSPRAPRALRTRRTRRRLGAEHPRVGDHGVRCALAGVILVTVNPSYQADELAYVLRQSRAAGIFLLPEFRGNPHARARGAVRDDCPELREVVLFSEWEAFLASAGDKPCPHSAPGDACMIQYTSGTTGFPKGALLHHRGLVNNGAHTVAIMGAERGSTYMGIMPLFHTGGCVLGRAQRCCRSARAWCSWRPSSPAWC
jgi:fatty-acyl-CoA synthase